MRTILSAALLATLASGLCAAEEKKGEGRRYALLIGVSKYDSPHLNDLEYADKDVDDLAGVLRESGYKAKDITVLNTAAKGKEPTAGRINAALAEFLSRDYAKDDVVLIAFSGHGVQIGEKFYFCPHGAKLDEVKDLIAIDSLYHQLKECKAGSRLVLTDTCRNDPTRKVPPIPVRAATKAGLDRGLPEDVVLFASCAPGQVSREEKEFKRGVFFHFVIEGLQGKADLDGDGKVTRAELEAYLRIQMAKHDKRQTPQVMARTTKDPAVTEIGSGVAADVPQPVIRIPATGSGYGSCKLAITQNGKGCVAANGAYVQVFDLEKRRRVAAHSGLGNDGVILVPQFFRSGALVLGDAAQVFTCEPVSGRRSGLLKIKNNPACATLSRDERRVAVGDVGSLVTILDVRGPVIETFDHSGGTVHVVALTPDGDKVLTGLERGKVFLWDVAKGRQLFDMEGHTGTLLAGVVTRDGSTALTVSDAGELIRWNLGTGKVIDKTDVNNGRETPRAVAFTPDGKRLLIGGKSGTVAFWDIPASGKPKLRVSYDKHKDNGFVESVAITPDGTRAISLAGPALWLYEVVKE